MVIDRMNRKFYEIIIVFLWTILVFNALSSTQTIKAQPPEMPREEMLYHNAYFAPMTHLNPLAKSAQ